MALPAILNSSNNFELLRKSESEVFDMIESAITVAALRFPEKLLAQQHRIFKPYNMACRSSSTNDNDDGGYNSTGYNQEITKEEEEEPVYNQEITKEEEEEEPTKPTRRIIRIKLVKDGKPTTATTVGTGANLKMAATTVGSGTGANLKMASDVPWSNSEDYEKKLENSKRKLKEGYSKFEDSRKRYEKLQRWDDALDALAAVEGAYTVEATLGRMRCLAALARWEELNNLCKEYWTPAEPICSIGNGTDGCFLILVYCDNAIFIHRVRFGLLEPSISLVRLRFGLCRQKHIRKYLPELLSLISELWSSFGLPATNRPSRGFPVNDGRLRTAGEASQRSTKEDWAEWMRHFSIEFLKKSRLLLQHYEHVLGLHNCSLEMAFSSPNIPPEILATLLNLHALNLNTTAGGNDCFREEYSALSGDCDSDIPWATEALGCLPEAVNLWIGNHLSETSFHKDHYENFYAVVSREKHFLLLPPTDVHRMYIRDYPAAQYSYDLDHGGEFRLEMDEPARYVPWCSVNPYPTPETEEAERSKLPLYFNGSKPFQCTVKAGEILYL
ncbi:Lysine-specific demethylase JMJ32 [Linum grandiflorum]